MKIHAKQFAQALYGSLKEAKGVEQFSLRARNFFIALRKHRALKQLPSILKELRTLEKGKTVTVTAARPLAQRVASALREDLRADHLDEKISPDVMGGMMVEWDDWRIDGSARGMLQKLRRHAG